MSFGWSANDISQAIGLVIKVVKALDSANGAAADYREAVGFLRSLKRTLEPLQTFAGLELYPTYGEEIRQHVEKIQGPISKFLASAAKFEPQLGSSAKPGRHRGLKKKLEWRGDLRTAFTDVLDPRLVELLQLHLEPLAEHFDQYEFTLPILQIEGSEHAQTMNHHLENIITHLQKQDLDLAEAVSTVKMYIENATLALKQEIVQQQASGYSRGLRSTASQHRNQLERSLDIMAQYPQGIVIKESLQELSVCHRWDYCVTHGGRYYLAFLYLGHFLRNFFLTVPLVVRPKPALTPILIAKYHISFYDAIGRSPRVLDYDCFANYKVFQAFLEDSFAGSPGASWVELGLYQLANARNGLTISSDTWSRMISPGSHINMSMLVGQVLARTSKSQSSEEVCPTLDCEGVLQKAGGSLAVRDRSHDLKESKSVNIVFEQNRSLVEQYPEMMDITDEYVPEVDGSGGAKIGATQPARTVKNALVDDMVHFKRVLRHPQPPTTFLFANNELSVNDDPSDGGVASRTNENGRWLPPVQKTGFRPKMPGALYRWTDGTITAADDCHFNDGLWLTPGASTPLTLYEATTMFYANAWTQFVSTPVDASVRDMATESSSSGRGRWWPLTFSHDESLSRIGIIEEEPYLAGSAVPWITDLGLDSYSHRHVPRAGGLAGSAAMIIALIAFPCRSIDLERILLVDRAWHLNKWRRHARTDDRVDEKGVVGNIYLDPENLPASFTFLLTETGVNLRVGMEHFVSKRPKMSFCPILVVSDIPFKNPDPGFRFPSFPFTTIRRTPTPLSFRVGFPV
ncbi:uncharacterized protein PAC_04943 [Phialocephala subalpina]|uniref:Ubiquitin-like domain-containing protein n=1 Tax=Phialocephala subalpina TaxID=576137 RepID=A0A1L7WQM4_9HELO|nr:uncharacterized protein PAC_04943 [Phialocephala subalpina]